MGKSTIVITLAIFAVTGIGLLYLFDKIAECKSLMGEFARLLSPEIQQKCTKASSFILIIVFAWVFSGFMSIAVIAYEIFRKSFGGGVVFIIVMSIVVLKLSGVF